MLAAFVLLSAMLYSNALAAGSLNNYPMALDNGTAPNEGYATFLEAAQSPNVSHSVPFGHYNEASGTPSDDTILKNRTWTVALSDVQMPSASTHNLTNVAYMTYEFSWPEQGDLNNALSAEVNASRNQNYPSCALLITAQFPDSISNKWDGTSNCSSALGANCTETLSRVMTTSSDECTVDFAVDDPDIVAACGDSFGSVKGDGWSVGGRVFGTSAISAMNQPSLQKDQTYAFSLSAPYAADNTTAFQTVASNLQVLALVDSRTELLCNRAGDGKSVTGAASSIGSLRSSILVTIVVFVVVLAAS